jgi:hypothetical protein
LSIPLMQKPFWGLFQGCVCYDSHPLWLVGSRNVLRCVWPWIFQLIAFWWLVSSHGCSVWWLTQSQEDSWDICLFVSLIFGTCPCKF